LRKARRPAGFVVVGITGALLIALPSAWLVTRALCWRQFGERLLDVLEWLYRRLYPADARRGH